jgi:carbon storage regulator
MLVLTRKEGESIKIGDNITVTVVEIKGGQVRLAIEAPLEIRIFREEIYEKVKRENLLAASQSIETFTRLKELIK